MDIKEARKTLESVQHSDELTIKLAEFINSVKTRPFNDGIDAITAAYANVFADAYNKQNAIPYAIANKVFPASNGYIIEVKNNRDYDVIFINHVKTMLYRRHRKTPDIGIVPSKQDIENSTTPLSWNTYESFPIINDEKHISELFNILISKHPEIYSENNNED